MGRNETTADAMATLERQPDGTALIRLRGDWNRSPSLPDAQDLAGQIGEGAFTRLEIDAHGLSAWGSALMPFTMQLVDACERRNLPVDLAGLPDGARRLVRLARAVPPRTVPPSIARGGFLAALGRQTIEFVQSTGEILAFLGECVQATGQLIRGKARFRRVDLLLFIRAAGVDAFPLVSLISLLIGMILAFVGAYQLRQFGAEIYIAAGVGIGVVREMAPMMTGIIMAGRTGAAYAAQIGTMEVNEETDALRTAGLSPIGFLVLPRMLALGTMMPMLCLYSILMGIGGGALVSAMMFDIPFPAYLDQTRAAVRLSDFGLGLTKSLVFGVVVAAVGCMRGLKCGRSASAVGDAATSAVVTSIVAIIVLDSLAAIIFTVLHI